MDVLAEILTWSKNRPAWQRDALRRLVTKGELDDDDIDTLSEIAKSAHGLAAEQLVVPLGKPHLPDKTQVSGRVDLRSIYHNRGVNALAQNQTLAFGPGLTVVYGDNAAGKSGYTRILKSACRARGMEDILGNVLSGETPLSPMVSIKYTVGNGDPQEWSGEDEDNAIARVSVFDSHCASVYLTQQTNVAFRPFGLDLFDKLSRACQSVRTKLESEKRALSGTTVQGLTLPEGTEAAKFVARLSSLTKPADLMSLVTLSENVQNRHDLLEKHLFDLQANDPAKIAQELALRAGRLRIFVGHLKAIDAMLSDGAIAEIFQAQADATAKRAEAKDLRNSTFPDGLLVDTGSRHWAQLWQAARDFSESSAYSGKDFPFTDEDAKCVLCQQKIGRAASTRLRRFQDFVVSVTETEYRKARERCDENFRVLIQFQIVTSTAGEALKEIRVEQRSLADQIETALPAAEARRDAILGPLETGDPLPADLPVYTSFVGKVEALAQQLDERVTGLGGKISTEHRASMRNELRELKARRTLAKHQELVLKEIERRKRIAAYGQCVDDTRTQGITAKSTAVTKVAVTQQLKDSFQEELKTLKFRHVEVELVEAGGEFGNLFHRLVLKRAPGVELQRVVSEGEARCLSIAAFFAELSTAHDPSAILFDDPVSSLDYKWRNNVARRLVAEAKSRQVIVFTHDIVFLLNLRQRAEQQDVPKLDQHVRQLPAIGAGVCAEELPWVALSVKRRIDYLKQEWQQAQKLWNKGHQAAYEKEAIYLYGLLREAWERGVEEVLLGKVVERYRTGIQTRQIELIVDIVPDDCKAVDVAMTKCSQWLPGHDQAPAAKEDVPEPDELRQDIAKLDIWVKAINKRRK